MTDLHDFVVGRRHTQQPTKGSATASWEWAATDESRPTRDGRGCGDVAHLEWRHPLAEPDHSAAVEPWLRSGATARKRGTAMSTPHASGVWISADFASVVR